MRAISRKINSWLCYEKARPKTAYSADPSAHDGFRRNNDLDCVLTNGDLRADTIFSLWLPLRFALVRLNGYRKLNRYGDINDKASFLSAISDDIMLRFLLPEDDDTVILLERLFELGQERCNVMILRDRVMQSRGLAPYYDYMPHFLNDCFVGAFSRYFRGNDDLKQWIDEQRLNMFFAGEVARENILDLSGSGDIKNGVPEDLGFMLKNYISILEERKKLL